MSRQSIISDGYLAEQRELHKDPNYGTASISAAPIVIDIMQKTGARSLSDYGAGKCNLHKAMKDRGFTDFKYLPYDPAFPDLGPPAPADLVCCIDVFEHIEPDYLDAVLDDLRSITRKIGFFSVNCGPANKLLADGRNAHLIQKPSSWWLPRLCERFEIVHLERMQGGFWMIVEPRAT
jgi:hypothetical protein